MRPYLYHLNANPFIMKKTLQLMLLSAGLMLGSAAMAQEEESGRVFKPFKVDVSLGYALPMGSGTGSSHARSSGPQAAEALNFCTEQDARHAQRRPV